MCTGESWHQRKKLQMKRPPYIPHQECVLHRTYASISFLGGFFPLSSRKKELMHPQEDAKNMLYNVFNHLALGGVNKRDSWIARYCRQGGKTTELKCVVKKRASWAEMVILSVRAGKQEYRRQCIIRTMACATIGTNSNSNHSVLEDVTIEAHVSQI